MHVDSGNLLSRCLLFRWLRGVANGEGPLLLDEGELFGCEASPTGLTA